MPRRIAMPHQVDALQWGKHRRSAAYYMQMRLGKSLVAIRWARSRPACAKILIQCPLSVVPSWRRECAAEGEPLCELVGTRAERGRAFFAAGRDHRTYVINHEGLVEHDGRRGARGTDFATLPWDVVIVDESTRIRNPKSKATKVALKHLARAPHRACLTGLPNPEGGEDFVCQMLFLNGSFMGHRNFWTWRQEHMQPTGYGWAIKSKSAGLIRAEVQESAFFLTRKEAGLPDEKLRTTRWVSVPPPVRAAMDQASRDFQVGGTATGSKLVVLGWLGRLAGGFDPTYPYEGKAAEVDYLLSTDFRGQKVAVWCRHTAEIMGLSAFLEARRRPCAVVTGAQDLDERTRRIARWESKSGPDVLVAQPRCLHVGVDLSAADVSIFYSNYHDFEIRAQAEDRIIHPRKAYPVLIVDIVAEDTVDEDVVDALAEKGADARTFSRRFLDRASSRVAKRRSAA